MTTGDHYPKDDDLPLPGGMFDVSENLPPQDDLKQLYADIDGAIKSPSQMRHVDIATRQDGYMNFSEMHLGADDAQAVLDDSSATGMLIKVIDPVEERPYREHRMLIENYFAASEGSGSSNLRGVSSYSFYREIKRGTIETYDLHKTPLDIEDISEEFIVIGPDETPPAFPDLPEDEAELKSLLDETERTITPFDIAVLRRLASILKS